MFPSPSALALVAVAVAVLLPIHAAHPLSAPEHPYIHSHLSAHVNPPQSHLLPPASVDHDITTTTFTSPDRDDTININILSPTGDIVPEPARIVGIRPWEDMEGHSVSPPVGASCNENHMDIYGFFFQSLVKQKPWTPETGFPLGKTGWKNLPGDTMSYVQAGVAAHRDDAAVAVDVVTSDDKYDVVMASHDGTSWSSDEMLHLGIKSFFAPVAIALPGKDLMVVVRGIDNRYKYRVRSGGKWGPIWGTLPEVAYSRISGIAVEDGTVFLFKLNAAGIIHYAKYHGGVWSSWVSLGKYSTNVPRIQPHARGFVMAFRDAGGGVHFGVHDYANNGWYYENLGGVTPLAPAVASPHVDRIDVVAVDADNRLVRKMWLRKTGWDAQWKYIGGIERIIFPPTVFARGTGHVEVFAVEAGSETRHYSS